MEPIATSRNFRLPDKVGAGIVIVGLLAVFGGAIVHFLDMIIELAQNVITLGAMVLGTFFVVSTIWGARSAIWYWQQNLIRKFRRSVIGEDPIGILESVIKRLRRRIEDIQESMASADAALKQTVATIAQARKESKNEENLARQASGTSTVQMKQHATASERWFKTAEELTPDAEKMAAMQERYGEALELATSHIADAENQKRIMAMKVRTAEAKRKAFAAFKTLFGQSEEWQMWGEAVEIIEMRSFEAEAQIDQLMQSVAPQVASQKLQQEADAQSALERLGLAAPRQQAALPEGNSGGQIVEGTVVSRQPARIR